jgi:hypothetical protein
MNTIDFSYVKQTLNANGITDEVLAENDNTFEAGTEEWMGVVSEVIGRNAYDGELTEDEQRVILYFISVMNQNGISSW